METGFRAAVEQDGEACRQLHSSQMQKTIRELNLDPGAHAAGFRERWTAAGVPIIQLDGRDVGRRQALDQLDELFAAQIFIFYMRLEPGGAGENV